MIAIGPILAFLRSRTLTLWLVAIFVLYYLTTAVWVGEAFGRYMNHLSANNAFRAFYLLFLANVVLRIADAAAASFRFRRAFLLRLPFYAGTVLFLSALFLSLNFRQTVWLPPVGVGDRLLVPWDQAGYEVVSVVPALKKKALRSDDSVIFDYEPGITVRDGNGRLHAVGAYPPRTINGAYYHVLQFGIAPGVELSRNGSALFRGQVALRLTPFGVVDTLELPEQPYRFLLSIVPNRIIQKGKETARDYDLTRPRYLVTVLRGDRTLAEGETEDRIAFDGTMSLSFYAPDDWVMIEAVRDPFLLWLVIGAGAMAAGACLFPWARHNHNK